MDQQGVQPHSWGEAFFFILFGVGFTAFFLGLNRLYDNQIVTLPPNNKKRQAVNKR
jgi:hypothetical protein